MTPSVKTRLGIAVPLLVLVLAMGLWGGPANPFEREAMERLTDLRAASPLLTSLAIALTWLGSAYTTLGLALATALQRWLAGYRAAAMWVLATVGGGRLTADLLKLAVDRPRPHLAPWPVPVSSVSFPSGHATNTMLAFGAIALALAPPRHRARLVGAAIVLSLLVGLTRPYLGVHWPSDVVAGWALGGAILSLAAPRLVSDGRSEA